MRKKDNPTGLPGFGKKRRHPGEPELCPHLSPRARRQIIAYADQVEEYHLGSEKLTAGEFLKQCRAVDQLGAYA